METLTPQERFMLIARFVDGKPFAAIGELLGLYRETVSSRIDHILKKLRRFLWQKRSWRLELKDIREYLEDADLRYVIVSEND
jgi:DNA-directed RNA polymerase specialized sigma24 family protein